ncbi:hypothetical protein ACWEF6_39610 [Amycolatopsis sp. NPDC004772]
MSKATETATWARSARGCAAAGLLSGLASDGVELGGAAELAGASDVDGDVAGAVEAGAPASGVGSSAAAGPANTLVSTAAAVTAAKPRARDLALLDMFTNSHP